MISFILKFMFFKDLKLANMRNLKNYSSILLLPTIRKKGTQVKGLKQGPFRFGKMERTLSIYFILSFIYWFLPTESIFKF